MIPPWTYEDSPFEPSIDDYGFIYQITFDDGTKYIGKKNLWVTEELPPLKSGAPRPHALGTVNRMKKLTPAELANRTPAQIRNKVHTKTTTMDIVQKESDWRKYTGSSKLTQDKTIVARTILATAPSKRYLTYLEVKAILCLDALEDDSYLNENCLGKFYKGNLL